MTKEVMIGMLKQGANGNEILQILEVLAANSDAPQPTLQELTFWEIWVSFMGHSSWQSVALYVKIAVYRKRLLFGVLSIIMFRAKGPPLF